MITSTETRAKIGHLALQDYTNRIDHHKLKDNLPDIIIIHSTRKYGDFDSLEQAHRARGFIGVGYHFFIAPEGKIFQARPTNKEGAHALGFNLNSIGIAFQSDDGYNLHEEAINNGKALIASLRNIHGPIEIISHTLAQVRHYNRLSEEAGLTERFNAGQDIVESEKFTKLKRDIDAWIASLTTTTKLHILKSRMKDFKNCPGPLMYKFI